MEEIVCRECGVINEFRTQMKSGQQTAWCTACGAFIKNIPYEQPKLHIGKYKGRTIASLRSEDEIQYIKWFLRQSDIKPKLKDQFEAHLRNLNRL